MKTVYIYSFNNEGFFSCKILNEETHFRLNQEKAIESLQVMNTLKFDRIQVFKHSIRLYKKDYEIHLKDLDLFVENQFDQYIPNLYQKIEKALKGYLHQEASKRKKQNKKLGQNQVFKVTLGAALMAVSLSSIHLSAEGSVKELPAAETTLLKPKKVPEESYDYQKQIMEAIETSSKTIDFNHSQNQENIVYLNYEKTNDLVKKEYAFQEFEELANWCGEKWGISSNLILMLLTQESAGKETNLMQIEWEQWAGKPIKVYNFRDHQYEKFLLTNRPTEEEKAEFTCISEEDLKNPKTNLSIGCVLLRKSAEAMNYHIMASLQCYNLGIGNMEKIFNKTKEETGQTREEILSNQSNLSFYEYTFLPGQGDPKYLSNVFQFIDNYGDSVTFKHLQNGEIIEETIYVYNHQQIL